LAMPDLSDSSLFSRRSFEWKPGFGGGKAAPAASPVEEAPEQDNVVDRVYEVIERTCNVRMQPHLKGRMKTRKSSGARVVCSEITMNGWLKLSSEPGWLLCNMQGMDGVCDVALPVDAPIFLAVPVYQPQGMCCLDVISDAGVPVLDSPSRQARTLSTLRRGEYAFSHTQNFDGWLRLAPGEGGWVCCHGGDALLRLRSDVREVDLWALADLWASARAAPGGLGPEDAEGLKELERAVSLEAKAVLDDLPDSDLGGLVEDGFLDEEDVSQPRSWISQRLFAHMLQLTVADDPRFGGFKMTPRVPPLPAAINEEGIPADGDVEPIHGAEEPSSARQQAGGELEEGPSPSGRAGALRETQDVPGHSARQARSDEPHRDAAAAADARLQPFEHLGRSYLRARNGALFTDPCGAPVGLWNPASGMIDPVAGLMPGCPFKAICYFGKTFLLMSDDNLLDWDTGQTFAVSNAMDVKKIVLQL